MNVYTNFLYRLQFMTSGVGLEKPFFIDYNSLIHTILNI